MSFRSDINVEDTFLSLNDFLIRDFVIDTDRESKYFFFTVDNYLIINFILLKYEVMSQKLIKFLNIKKILSLIYKIKFYEIIFRILNIHIVLKTKSIITSLRVKNIFHIFQLKNSEI